MASKYSQVKLAADVSKPRMACLKKKVRFQDRVSIRPVEMWDKFAENTAAEVLAKCGLCQDLALLNLDLYKAFEMKVHPESRQYTRFMCSQFEEAQREGALESILEMLDPEARCWQHHSCIDERYTSPDTVPLSYKPSETAAPTKRRVRFSGVSQVSRIERYDKLDSMHTHKLLDECQECRLIVGLNLDLFKASEMQVNPNSQHFTAFNFAAFREAQQNGSLASLAKSLDPEACCVEHGTAIDRHIIALFDE